MRQIAISFWFQITETLTSQSEASVPQKTPEQTVWGCSRCAGAMLGLDQDCFGQHFAGGWYLVILTWFMKVLSMYILHSLKRRLLSYQTLWPKAVVSDSGRSDGARGRRPQLRLLRSLSSFFPTQCQKPQHACSSSHYMLRKKCLNPPLLGRGVLKDGTETGSLLNPAHLHLV